MDGYVLENIVRDNRLSVAMFLPFTIARLRGEDETALEAMLTVCLQNISEAGEATRMLHLTWSPESVPLRQLPLQERSITEYAACGVACVLVPLYANQRILQVAEEEDGFDYWIGDGKQEWGLEVSGTRE